MNQKVFFRILNKYNMVQIGSSKTTSNKKSTSSKGTVTPMYLFAIMQRRLGKLAYNKKLGKIAILPLV